jgi:hypothetical protein
MAQGCLQQKVIGEIPKGSYLRTRTTGTGLPQRPNLHIQN